MRLLLTSLLFLLVSYMPCSAYFAKKAFIKQYTVENGLPQNSVIDILQDSDGFIWVSTTGGVRKTDGSRVYELTGPNAQRINNMQSAYMAIDSCKNIWFATSYLLAMYNHGKQTFEIIREFRNASSSFNVLLFPYPTGNKLYYYKRDEGLFCINTNTRKIDFLRAKNYYLAKSPNQIYYFYLPDKNSFYYFLDGSFYAINLETLTERCLFENKGPKGKNASQYFHDTFMPYLQPLLNKKGFVGGFELERTDALMAYTETNSFLINPTGNYPQCEIRNSQGTSISPGSIIHKQITDKSGNIWVNTLNNGLWMIGNYNNPFTFWLNEQQPLNFVRSIYHDKTNRQIIATLYQGGFNLFDEQGRFLEDHTHYKHHELIEKANVTNAIQTDSAHYVLFTQKSPYNYLLDLKKKTILPISLLPAGAEELFSFYTSVYQIGLFDYLVCSSHDIYAVKNSNSRPTASRIYTGANVIGGVKQYGKALYIGETGGFSVFDRINGNTRHIKLYDKAEAMVKDFWQAADGSMYIATTQGLFVWHEKQEPRQITGLPDDFIYGLIPGDKQGDLVMPCNKGLITYNTQTRVVGQFTSKDGLISNECNTNAFCKLPDGRILIGSLAGINAFHPTELYSVHPPAMPVITSIQVDGQSLFTDSMPVHTNKLLLGYRQNEITVSLADLSFTPDHQRIYRYKLNTYDTGWRYITNTNEISIALQPGSYLLQLQTGNSVTHQYSPARLLTIDIEPPFWKKWWFYCSELAVALLSAYGVGALLHRRKLKKALAEIALQQTIQQERERISRELHDNLGAQATALNAGLRNLQHNAAIAPELLRDVTETGATIMQNLRESIWALNNRQISLQNLSDRYKVFAKNILKNYPEIKLIYRENMDEEFMLMPVAALNLLRIMQEALHNTLKHAAASEITVQIACRDRFSIQYRDNGKGFDTTRYADPNSNGLHNMQARASEAGLEVIISSQPGNGTLITINQKIATQP